MPDPDAPPAVATVATGGAPDTLDAWFEEFRLAVMLLGHNDPAFYARPVWFGDLFRTGISPQECALHYSRMRATLKPSR